MDDSKIIVVGSANVDTSILVKEFPIPGETLFAQEISTSLGGKGFNQAVASARCKVPTTFIGCFGEDGQVDKFRSFARELPLDLAHSQILPDTITGSAFITRSQEGENNIIVASAANAMFDELKLDGLELLLDENTIVVLQGEIPAKTNARVIEIAHEVGAFSILNLAPPIAMPRDVLSQVDLLVLNEVEACALLGIDKFPDADDLSALLVNESRTVIVTIGAKGALLITPSGTQHLKTVPQEAVLDTTGAGDAFVGVLAASLSRGHDLESAVSTANRAAGLSTLAAGASESYPWFNIGIQ